MEELVSTPQPSTRCTGVRNRGFSLVELLIVMAIIAILVAIAVPTYVHALGEAKETLAVRELTDLQSMIDLYEVNTGSHPLSLADLGEGHLLDPWGNPYQFLNFATVKGKGQMRKDKFLVPLNSKYDLYSSGPDGKSQTPLTAKHSRDDIIRANDGSFIGPAYQY